MMFFWVCIFLGTHFSLNAHSVDQFAQALNDVQPASLVTDKRLDLALIVSEPMNIVLKGSKRGIILDTYVHQVTKKLAFYNDLIVRPKPYDVVRVMSYNVHYWADPYNKKLIIDDVFNLIAEIGADVVCLQEVNLGKTNYNQNYTASDIIKKMRTLGYTYGDENTFITVAHFFGAPFGNIIFSKYKISDLVTELYQDGQRGFVGVTIECNGKPLRIYCTHFEVQDGKKREDEAKEFVEYVNKNDLKKVKDVFLVGDFNEARKKDYQPDIWKAYIDFMKKNVSAMVQDSVSHVLHKAHFKDAYELTGYKPPFTCWTGSIIDFGYLLQGGDWMMKSVNVYFDSTSDHMPIIFDLALK